MWFYILFVFLSPRYTQGFDCTAETIICSQYLPTVQHGNSLILLPKQLDDLCEQRDKYLKCLDYMLPSGVLSEANLTPGLENFIKIGKDMCSDTSPWRKMYLELEPCINQQSTEFCRSPEFLGKLLLDDGVHNKCSIHEETVNCVAETLATNCGIGAEKLFNHLLGRTRDGDKNCYSVGSENLYRERQAFAEDKREAYHVYNSLLKRIGSLSEQDESMEDSVLMEDVPEDKYWISDPVNIVDLANLLRLRYIPAEPVYAKPVDLNGSDRYGDRKVPLKLFPGNSYPLKEHIFPFDSATVVRSHGNFSVAIYYRSLSDYEFLFCFKTMKDGKKKFACEVSMREMVPECVEGGRRVQDHHARIVPEDIDPELGTKLYAMHPYAYSFRPLEAVYDKVYRRILRYPPSSIGSLPIDDISVWAKSSATEHIASLYKSLYGKHSKYPVSNPDHFSSATEFKTSGEGNAESENWNLESILQGSYASTSEEKPLDLVKSYLMAVTTLIPPKLVEKRTGEALESAASLGVEVDEKIYGPKRISKQEKLLELKELENVLQLSRFLTYEDTHWITPSTAILYYDALEDMRLNNFICGRVNECHPNATDIWKCVFASGAEEKESMETTEKSTHGMTSTEPSTDKENADQSLLVEVGSDRLENVKHIIRFDESHQRSLNAPVTEGEIDHVSFTTDDHPAEAEEILAELETEPVQLLPIEPDDLPVPDSQSYKTEVANDSAVESLALMSDDNTTSYTSDDIDIGEGLRQKLAFIASLRI